MKIRVSLSLNVFDFLTYEYTGAETDIVPGRRVVVPVGNRVATAWIVDRESGFNRNVKRVFALIEDGFLPDERYLTFCQSVARTQLRSLGSVLDAGLPPGRKSLQNFRIAGEAQALPVGRYSAAELASLSRSGPLRLLPRKEPVCDTPAGFLSPPGFEHVLLLGHRRDARLEEFAEHRTKQGQAVLWLEPDHLSAAFHCGRTNGGVIYDASLSPRERERLWHLAQSGGLRRVYGGVLAAMLPLPNLAAVISDRSASPLQRRIRGRSGLPVHLLGETRARAFDLPLLEGAAVHTVQTFALGDRVRVEDERGERRIHLGVHPIPAHEKRVPESMVERVKRYRAEGKKVLLVVNKKTSTPFLYCQNCRRMQICPRCRGLLVGGESLQARCRDCGFSTPVDSGCGRCGNALVEILDVSIASLKKRMKAEVEGGGVLTLTAKDMARMDTVRAAVDAAPLVLATPSVLNPFFKGLFDAIVYFRPETSVDMNDTRAGEWLFYLGAELREWVKDGGYVDVFSTFHFFYALKLLEDEKGYYAREMKYRRWFHLPPFAHVYQMEIRHRDLRRLGGRMREVAGEATPEMKIVSRTLLGHRRVRGFYRGRMEIHAPPETLAATGWLKARDMVIRIVSL